MTASPKILVIGPSWVGDMVMSQALYISLKQQHPSATIDVLAPAWCKPILDRMPQVNHAIEMPIGHGEFNFSGRVELARSLRNKAYTQAIVCPNSAKSALIPWMAKIPKRTGWKGEFRYGLLNDIRTNKKSFPLMVERYVALAHTKSSMSNATVLGGLENLPKPSLFVDPSIQGETLDKFGLDKHTPAVGLCPGAEFGPAKQWPVEHYATVAKELLKSGYQVWLFGSAKDRQTTQAIAAQADQHSKAKIANLAGETSLIEAVDLLAACQTVVSNDSGLMHVAGAVGCHVIGVYGSTSFQYTPPLANRVDTVSTNIECRPCFKRECPLGHLKCLKELSPSRVLDCIDSPKF
ncbi:ADP-heptose--LPS heptosyltransferase [Vibrio sp. qd031]|uniref:lipopolysaccharide heptosyltransferase II n=1 Tax=Vibrio sp. qd031 TaxID=1603038 RepID=UPI000A11DDE0|nr:lipopolysaccharide heptosyltransferase II [Vibrio sp. qd031]ORT51855.1 ADP-heptose--LPS heptosyltransferase [Vibrio sp. qd031]